MTEPVISDLQLNRHARVSVTRTGAEANPVLIVDEVLADPAALVDFAATAAVFDAPAPGSYYPGLNAHLPANYLAPVLGALRTPMAALYGIRPEALLPAFGFLGLTVTPPDRLAPLQRIPHVDSSNAHAFAAVHYLCPPGFGGTGLYRHKATGFETISQIRSVPYRRHCQAEGGPGAANPQADFYEEIAVIEPVFNRLVLYRASQLHAPLIRVGDALSADPRRGRLTANLFINTPDLTHSS